MDRRRQKTGVAEALPWLTRLYQIEPESWSRTRRGVRKSIKGPIQLAQVKELNLSEVLVDTSNDDDELKVCRARSGPLAPNATRS